MKIHPVTALYPPLGPDELLDLAEDIETNGQAEPIVLDADGMLLDGRGRVAACELADVEPRFTTYRGDAPFSLIVSANRHRPNTTPGQRAMITAMGRSLSQHALPTDTIRCGINLTRLSIATTVLEHAPDLAEQVRTATLSLNAAHKAARRRKADAKAVLAQHAQLRGDAPDLVEQVIAGRLTLTEATAALDVRREEELRKHVEGVDAGPADNGTNWRHAHRQVEQFFTQRHEAARDTRRSLAGIAEVWNAVQSLAHHSRNPQAREILKGLTGPARDLANRLIAHEAGLAVSGI
ncbi:hypothetical protein [Kitasatospora sp. NPDC090091]|uniref:hypothetical protein n=1 Tax=Kitasatospora sp. NPDC090091 TaxID=3364081 RepID=UPI0038024617